MSLAPHCHVFAGGSLDRAGAKRRDVDWLAQALGQREARVVCLGDGQQPFCVPGEAGSLEAGWLSSHALGALPVEGPPIFLGLDDVCAPHFAVRIGPEVAGPDGPLHGLGEFHEMRAAAMRLNGADTAALGCAKALFDWHARHGFCAACGSASDLVDGGWRRRCSGCGAEHFPRVDPVVIMLPIAQDRCLVGRQARFPQGMWSALAGFVEPGESLEEAVAREVLEEVGQRVLSARYHSSQPWPFPSSMMVGFLAEVEPSAIVLDAEELEDAQWFTRAQMRSALAGQQPGCHPPPPFAIAHWLIKAWVQEG